MITPNRPLFFVHRHLADIEVADPVGADVRGAHAERSAGYPPRQPVG